MASGTGYIGGEAFEYVLYADASTPRPWALRAALEVAVGVLEANGPWVRLARAYVMTHSPGDCLYVPPAWLLDLDDRDRAAARAWRLMRGTLIPPESSQSLEHCWLEVNGIVVSVSNLGNGYPAYVMGRDDYYRRNKVTGEPVGLSPRTLRVAARQRGLGPELARWLHAQGVARAGRGSRDARIDSACRGDNAS
jgi:hypothetical protein